MSRRLPRPEPRLLEVALPAADEHGVDAAAVLDAALQRVDPAPQCLVPGMTDMTTKRHTSGLVADAVLIAVLIAVFIIMLTRGQVLHWIGLI
ncbi:MAG: hypothetical protein ACRDSZ_22695 [Pseudonocardiaceae bacterium]